MYCKNCGAFVDDDRHNCSICNAPTEKEEILDRKGQQRLRHFYSVSDEKYDAETKKHIKIAVIFSFLSITVAIVFSSIIGLIFLVLNDDAAMIVSDLSAIPGMIFSVLSSKNLKKISNDYKEDNLRNIILIKILNTCGFVISFISLAIFVVSVLGFFSMYYFMKTFS